MSILKARGCIRVTWRGIEDITATVLSPHLDEKEMILFHELLLSL
jgi:hypothetical protein